jgi:hypothetical protein
VHRINQLLKLLSSSAADMGMLTALNDYLYHNEEQSESVTATCGKSISTEAYENSSVT